MGHIERVAIIGAGNMGSGIAQKSAQEHFMVEMVDREQQWVERENQSSLNFFLKPLKGEFFAPSKSRKFNPEFQVW